jgi:7,8-didemethyl-8-hydroxy-5-deazariboflavin synthase CofG subunit
MTSGKTLIGTDPPRPRPDQERIRSMLSGAYELDPLREMAWNLTPRTVTFSTNFTVPVTRLCRNSCAYCSFRNPKGAYLTWGDILPLLRAAEEAGCCEALFMSGERPEDRYGRAREFLKGHGFRTTPDYVAWLCGRTLDETELLPHTNVGILEADEVASLGKVNASLGLMLEDSSERLCGRGMAHEKSPGKSPRERLRTIEEAGMQRIPFTTGILVGIGQNADEIFNSLLDIKRLAERYHHIQEIIIQRFLPKKGTPMETWPTPSTPSMLRVFSVARLLFGRNMSIQVPPNIERNFEEFIRSGANDLGGISPITRDEINPETTWLKEDEIINRVSSIGCRAKHRPPVYEGYARGEFLSPKVLDRTLSWLGRYDALEGNPSQARARPRRSVRSSKKP